MMANFAIAKELRQIFTKIGNPFLATGIYLNKTYGNWQIVMPILASGSGFPETNFGIGYLVFKIFEQKHAILP